MSCKIFVGNLPWRIGNDELSAMLADMGHKFRSAKVIADRDTGRSRGFGFVEFDTEMAADDAMRDLNGHVVDGRSLRANLADEKSKRKGSSARNRRDGGLRDRRKHGNRFGDVWGEGSED